MVRPCGLGVSSGGTLPGCLLVTGTDAKNVDGVDNGEVRFETVINSLSRKLAAVEFLGELAVAKRWHFGIGVAVE
jgi:hypothetical protein